MATETEGGLSGFVEFLGTTQVQLAAVFSAVPLLNVLLEIIPLHFLVINPYTVTVITTLFCSVVILFIFTGRDQLSSQNIVSRRQLGLLSVVAGVLGLLGYIFVSFAYRSSWSYYYTSYYRYYGQEYVQGMNYVYEAIMVLLYIFSFALIVSGFVTLGLIEYQRTN